MTETRTFGRRLHQLEGLGVDRRRSAPVGELELGARLEENPELSALWSQPETLLAAEDMDVVL